MKVWAEGYPKSSPPLECEVGLTFCEEHKHNFRLEDIPCLDQICASACRAYSKRNPDFKTATIEMKPLLVG